MKYYIRKKCRICGKRNLKDFIFLGKTPLADNFPRHKNTHEEYYPLDVKVCPNCMLVQLTIVVDDDILFGKDYGFFTGGSISSIKYFKDYAKETVESFPSQARKSILEIASNDGLLLQNFKNLGYENVLGIDPAAPPVEAARKKGISTLLMSFNKKTAEHILKKYKKSSLIIANNVVAHVDDLIDFMDGIKLLLDDQGVFIFECHYFPNLLFSDQFDNIYHEHRSFFSLIPLIHLLKKVELNIFDIRVADTQGGSIRVFVSKEKRKKSVFLKEMISNEYEIRLDKIDTYLGFQARANYLRKKTLSKLLELKKEGYKIYGYGASAKGNTMLNYLGISSKIIDKVVDKTPYKVGKFTPGTKIPIEDQSNSDAPDYYFLLVWNYLSGVLEREKDFRKNGGKFIVPTLLPYII